MKTTMFVIVAIAALGATGVTTSILSSITSAQAQGPQCHTTETPSHVTICPPGSVPGLAPRGFVINPGLGQMGINMKLIGPKG